MQTAPAGQRSSRGGQERLRTARRRRGGRSAAPRLRRFGSQL